MTLTVFCPACAQRFRFSACKEFSSGCSRSASTNLESATSVRLRLPCRSTVSAPESCTTDWKAARCKSVRDKFLPSTCREWPVAKATGVGMMPLLSHASKYFSAAAFPCVPAGGPARGRTARASSRLSPTGIRRVAALALSDACFCAVSDAPFSTRCDNVESFLCAMNTFRSTSSLVTIPFCLNPETGCKLRLFEVAPGVSAKLLDLSSPTTAVVLALSVSLAPSQDPMLRAGSLVCVEATEGDPKSGELLHRVAPSEPCVQVRPKVHRLREALVFHKGLPSSGCVSVDRSFCHEGEAMLGSICGGHEGTSVPRRAPPGEEGRVEDLTLPISWNRGQNSLKRSVRFSWLSEDAIRFRCACSSACTLCCKVQVSTSTRRQTASRFQRAICSACWRSSPRVSLTQPVSP
mmetsp:Transcript_37041/g.94725  ORF Transcript_37041/g.94725 Transcript_37041/m.94725 type:complete len:407 (+) Transcript_37041:2803-4023(+)